MSTIEQVIPQPPLQWWRLRLEPNSDGHVAIMHYNPPEPVGTVEIFDGCDTALGPEVVATRWEHTLTIHYLDILMLGGPPTPNPGWRPLGHPIPIWLLGTYIPRAQRDLLSHMFNEQRRR